jgi:hypothetical protein
MYKVTLRKDDYRRFKDRVHFLAKRWGKTEDEAVSEAVRRCFEADDEPDTDDGEGAGNG